MDNSNFVLKQNCALCYIEDELNASDIGKIKKYLASFPRNKQIYCRFWIRGICIFPPHICPHSHGFSDFEFVEPTKRTKENVFFHVNTDKSLKFEVAKKSLPFYIQMLGFQQELLDEKLITKEDVLTQHQIDTQFDPRYRLRGIYQKREGLRFIQVLYKLAKERNFFLTRKFIENEFRRVKLNKMNVRLPGILESNTDLVMIPALIPPLANDPTEIIISKNEIPFFLVMKTEKNQIFYLKNSNTIEERSAVMSQYLSQIPLNKAILCDIWFRGFCEFEKDQCKNAHGINDLIPEAFNINFLSNKTEENSKKSKIKIKLKIETRNYRHYFDYQEILLKKGILQKSETFTLQELNSDNEKKLFLRKLIQKDLACEYLKRLFCHAGKKEPYLQKTICEKMLKKIGFSKLSLDIFNSEYFYEIKTLITDGDKKFKSLVIVEAPQEDLNQQTEEKIRESVEDLIKQKKNLTISLINNAYYKKIKPLEPPLNYFLRRRGQSLIDYLKELQERKIITFPENFNFENEMKIKKKMVDQEIINFWKENKKKNGLCKKTKIKTYVESKLGENGPFGRNEFEKFIFGSDNILINFHLGPFVLNLQEFFCLRDLDEDDNDEEDKKIKKKQCTSKSDKNPKKINFNEFKNEQIEKRVTLINDFEKFQVSARFLKDFKIFAVDLEGNLSGGAIDLIQIGVKQEEIERIFIFDIFVLKTEKIFEEVIFFLKEILENSNKIKLFFDCQKDSFALHKCLNIHCENVIDLAGFHILLESLSFNLDCRKSIVYALEFQPQCKLPNLNEVLEKYQAKNGLNPFKEEMKLKFDTEPVEYFQIRPIAEKFLEYAAKDVEDLEDIYGKMMKRLMNILKDFEVKAEVEVLEHCLNEISQKYVKQGCDI